MNNGLYNSSRDDRAGNVCCEPTPCVPPVSEILGKLGELTHVNLELALRLHERLVGSPDHISVENKSDNKITFSEELASYVRTASVTNSIFTSLYDRLGIHD